ncbi:MAG: hypothetical protein COY40_06045 [Alphaproteobacteria bacterium CG_4_10_14_0_8_um_filter_53_9]|nr:MAG: hypothetical protein COY40_06045 [Alphaproteobacteria bacterium CG_4_10_14_0_8_um_filter_53_9]
MLAHFGLAVDSEEPHALGAEGVTMWVHVLSAPLPGGVGATEATQRLPLLQEAMMAALAGQDEEDDLSRLILTASLSRFDVTMLRAIVAYAHQVGPFFHGAETRPVLLAHPAMAGALVALVRARLQPGFSGAARKRMEEAAITLWQSGLAQVATNAEERVLTLLWHIATAMLRTNAWGRDEEDALAIKLNSSLIPELPQPLPYREIFVSHPTVEGAHLRGGPVARGGLRYSDRPQDFRTEVLALMDAQVKKNVIIVPTGAKGGFVIKQVLPAERAEAGTVIQQCYVRFIRALLSVTDTREADQVLPPRGVVCRDEPDPYLVVAADKGTATFSDLANITAMQADFWEGTNRGFWLQDAFASGGSQGYDHKAMGITARGAWVSVAHHASQLGISPGKERPLTVIGIGDMAGDVFGNGLLRDKNVQLIAAFNHKHIFLDPNPDPAESFKERQRMFKEKCGWDGYTQKLISSGGGVYLRTAKSINVSAQAAKVLDMPAGPTEPEALIQAILKAPADVLWNGGIGTYIKASFEAHTAASDKANDAVRVDAKHVHAKIIGEGGNLGITTMGRVELAHRGVALNTDALDNSAGVDTSDHEVNLKILLADAEARGWLKREERDKLLAAATEEIAAQVLANNHAQNWAITLAVMAPSSAHASLSQWQSELSKQGFVSPKREGLPSAAHLQERKDGKYTRPELAVLLAATKRALRAAIAGENWLNDECLMPWVENAFPASIKAAFGKQKWETLVTSHPLRSTLAEMAVVNTLVNRLGLTQAATLRGENALGLDHVVHALFLAMEITDARTVWEEMDTTSAPFATVRAAGVRLRSAVSQLAAWLLAHPQPLDGALWRAKLTLPKEGFTALGQGVPGQTEVMVKERVEGWKKDGLPQNLAEKLGHTGLMVVWPEAVILAEQTGSKQKNAMTMLLAVSEALHLPRLNQSIRRLEGEGDDWTRQATSMLLQELLTRQHTLARTLIEKKVSPEDVQGHMPQLIQGYNRYQKLIGSLGKRADLTLPQLTVLTGRLRLA